MRSSGPLWAIILHAHRREFMRKIRRLDCLAWSSAIYSWVEGLGVRLLRLDDELPF